MINESLPNTISKEEQAKIKEYMAAFLKNKKTWIDKYGLKNANFVMYKTAVNKAKKDSGDSIQIDEGMGKSLNMDNEELRTKIESLVRNILSKNNKADQAAVEYDELTKFPELKKIIVDLLTPEFDNFISSIDWVAPRPTKFRINLKNGQSFYLTYGKRSWTAEIEGKRYYLLNMPEEQRAAESISRILTYGTKKSDEEGGDYEADTGEEEQPIEEPSEEETPE